MSCTGVACTRRQPHCRQRRCYRCRNALASFPRTQTYVFFLVLVTSPLKNLRSYARHRCWLGRSGIFARTCCRTRRPVYCQQEEYSSGLWGKKAISVRNARVMKPVTAPNYSSCWLVKLSSKVQSVSRSWRGPVESCICKHRLGSVQDSY
jgi:hypothetical protein